MSFYSEIKTELKEKRHIVAALEELKKRGEITIYTVIEKKDLITVDRSGDVMNIALTKEGTYRIEGDARIINIFAKRLTQLYAYEAIRENLPLDFEIVAETEREGNITLLLKG
jgi:hypothetical protein